MTRECHGKDETSIWNEVEEGRGMFLVGNVGEYLHAVVSAQLQNPAALLPGIELPLPIGEVARCSLDVARERNSQPILGIRFEIAVVRPIVWLPY
jgi:hypothetical protein